MPFLNFELPSTAVTNIAVTFESLFHVSCTNTRVKLFQVAPTLSHTVCFRVHSYVGETSVSALADLRPRHTLAESVLPLGESLCVCATKHQI